MMRLLSLLFVLSLSTVLMAAEPEKKEGPWKGEAELGLLTTRGNTNTDTLNAKLGISYRQEAWLHRLKLEALRTEDNGDVTVDRFLAQFRSDYNLAGKSYLFGTVRYEDDPFAGFDRRTTELVGYGFHIIDDEVLKWDIEAGLGARQTERTDNTESDETIYRLATNVHWVISNTSSFNQEIFVEGGDENTQTESTTELKVRINSALATKISLKIKDNSQVPAGKKHTDTETAVTLVYDF